MNSTKIQTPKSIPNLHDPITLLKPYLLDSYRHPHHLPDPHSQQLAFLRLAPRRILGTSYSRQAICKPA